MSYIDPLTSYWKGESRCNEAYMNYLLKHHSSVLSSARYPKPFSKPATYLEKRKLTKCVHLRQNSIKRCASLIHRKWDTDARLERQPTDKHRLFDLCLSL